MMTNDETKYVRTRDLPLAASIALHHPVQDVESAGNRQVYFLFPATPEVNDLVERYHRRELAVEPFAYFNELKALKARLYSN